MIFLPLNEVSPGGSSLPDPLLVVMSPSTQRPIYDLGAAWSADRARRWSGRSSCANNKIEKSGVKVEGCRSSACIAAELARIVDVPVGDFG